MQYSLSLDANFVPFFADDFTSLKKSSNAPNRGLEPDGNDVATTRRLTAFQKDLHLELMLGQIANFFFHQFRLANDKGSLWLSVYWCILPGFLRNQTRGRMPQRFISAFNVLHWRYLLVANGPITHHGANTISDEELTPTLENMVVLTWLKLIHTDLPNQHSQNSATAQN